jgi:hypothetical protein
MIAWFAGPSTKLAATTRRAAASPDGECAPGTEGYAAQLEARAAPAAVQRIARISKTIAVELVRSGGDLRPNRTTPRFAELAEIIESSGIGRHPAAPALHAGTRKPTRSASLLGVAFTMTTGLTSGRAAHQGRTVPDPQRILAVLERRHSTIQSQAFYDPVSERKKVALSPVRKLISILNI